jgi:cytochrome c5
MQLRRALLHLTGLGAMVLTSASVRLLASDEPSEPKPTFETMRHSGLRGAAQGEAEGRKVEAHDCAGCHSAGRGGS